MNSSVCGSLWRGVASRGRGFREGGAWPRWGGRGFRQGGRGLSEAPHRAGPVCRARPRGEQRPSAGPEASAQDVAPPAGTGLGRSVRPQLGLRAPEAKTVGMMGSNGAGSACARDSVCTHPRSSEHL